MSKRRKYISLMSCLVVWLVSCDTTIHEYPQTEENALILLELNADRTPPQYYKEVTYDHEGNYQEAELEATLSSAYIPDERLSMRLIAELYKLSSVEDRVDQGVLVARRIVTVDRLKEAPQDTLKFHVPAGIYRALTWADYTLKDNANDWHLKLTNWMPYRLMWIISHVTIIIKIRQPVNVIFR